MARSRTIKRTNDKCSYILDEENTMRVQNCPVCEESLIHADRVEQVRGRLPPDEQALSIWGAVQDIWRQHPGENFVCAGWNRSCACATSQADGGHQSAVSHQLRAAEKQQAGKNSAGRAKQCITPWPNDPSSHPGPGQWSMCWSRARRPGAPLYYNDPGAPFSRVHRSLGAAGDRPAYKIF